MVGNGSNQALWRPQTAQPQLAGIGGKAPKRSLGTLISHHGGLWLAAEIPPLAPTVRTRQVSDPNRELRELWDHLSAT